MSCLEDAAPSAPTTPPSPWRGFDDTSDSDRTSTTSPSSFGGSDECWADAQSSPLRGSTPPNAAKASSPLQHRRRRESWSSISSSGSSPSRGTSQSGRGSPNFLEQLQQLEATPPPSPRATDEEAFTTRSEHTERLPPIILSGLVPSPSCTTLKAESRPVLEPYLADIDIDSLLRAFDDFAAERRLDLAVESWRGEVAPELLRPRTLSFSDPSRHSFSTSTSSFPTPPSPTWYTPGPRDSLPYMELFPAHSGSAPVFPSRRNSSTSSHSSSSLALPFPSIFPTFTSTFPSRPKQRSSVSSTSSGYSQASSSYSNSTRRSSVRSSDSFRWSLTSGSTAPPIAEGEETDSHASARRASIAASSSRSFPSRRASTASIHQERMGEDVSYEDFLLELAEGRPTASEGLDGVAEDIDEEGPAASATSEVMSRSPLSSSTALSAKVSIDSSTSSGRTSVLPSLTKSSSSGFSLRRIRSSMSFFPLPTVPVGAGSLSGMSSNA